MYSWYEDLLCRVEWVGEGGFGRCSLPSIDPAALTTTSDFDFSTKVPREDAESPRFSECDERAELGRFALLFPWILLSFNVVL